MSMFISGLASGLDTSSMISELMKIERFPYTRLETKKSNLRSEQAIFRNVNTKLSALQAAMADLKYASTFNLSSSKSSDETAIRATSVEGASTGTFNINVTHTAQSHTIASSKINGGNDNLVGQEFTISLAGKDPFVIKTDGLKEGATNKDVLEYVKNQINRSDTGVNASVMSVNDAGELVLVLSSKTTGEESIFVAGNAGDDTKEIGLIGFGDLGFGTNAAIELNTTQEARNAEFTVNGVSVSKSTNTVKDVITGVTLELLKDNSSSVVTVAADANKVAEKIDAFVKAYNDVVTIVKDNLAKPADETKMNPLQGDSVLKDISLSMNRIFTDAATELEAGFRMMTELGLTIDKGKTKPSEMTSKITFDKELFKSKLEESPDKVFELFKTTMDNLESRVKVWNSSVDGLVASKIKGYDAEIKLVDERMVAMDNRLIMKEQQLKNQFTAMEVALSNLKSQQSWLTTQLASLTSLTANNNK